MVRKSLENKMLTLTRKTDYALVAMTELARCAPEQLSARKIAELSGLPLPILSGVLHQLHAHGLIVSVRGKQGGYSLMQSPDEISLADMIEAIEGGTRLAVCCHEDSPTNSDECDIASNCRIKEPIRRVNESFQRFLSQVSLAHVAFDKVSLDLASLRAKF